MNLEQIKDRQERINRDLSEILNTLTKNIDKVAGKTLLEIEVKTDSKIVEPNGLVEEITELQGISQYTIQKLDGELCRLVNCVEDKDKLVTDSCKTVEGVKQGTTTARY